MTSARAVLGLLLAVTACDSPAGPGEVSLNWVITVDSDGGDCEQARGATVELWSGGSQPVASWACEDGDGVTDELEPGVYEFTAYLLDASGDQLDARNAGEGTETLEEGVSLDLGTVEFLVDIFVEDCDQEGDEDEDGDADCDDADCDEDPFCTGAEDCNLEGDEDDDGDADCEDEDCSGDADCQLDCTAAEVTIADVYTQGGAGGATYNVDFIVLKNRSSQPYDLSGHSLQTSTILLSSWEVHALPDESIPGNGTYLVTVGMTGSQGLAPPTPDEAFGTGDLSSGVPFTVALMPDAVALTACPDGAPDGAIDLFSAGQDACAEGDTVPAPGADGATEWYTRDTSGCADTDDNATDLSVETAGTPRNSASAPVDCACPAPI